MTDYHRPPSQEELLDATRRHICQVLGFDYCSIELIQNGKLSNLAVFGAAELGAEDLDFIETLVDENGEPAKAPDTALTNQVRQDRQALITKLIVKESPQTMLPYAIVPIVDGANGSSGHVRGLLRVVSFEQARDVDKRELSTLKLIAEHLYGKLPRQATEQPAPPAFELDTRPIEGSGILVVHSNRLVRRRFSRVLGSRYQVIEVESTDKAAEKLKQQKLDLILLDGEMEKKTDYQFCKKLKGSSQLQHIPIILIVPESDVTGRVEGLNAGAEDCVSESFHESELLARVRASLRLRKTETDLATQWQLLEDYAQKLEQSFEAERQANLKATHDNQSLEQLNRELKESKFKEQVLRGQEQLLHRISNIIRSSFSIGQNMDRTLEELAGHFNLDCCFIVAPSEDEPEDTVRNEYTTDSAYRLLNKQADLLILDKFSKEFTPEQSLTVSDAAHDKSVESFRTEVIEQYHIKSLFYVPITYEEKLLGLLGGHCCESAMVWTPENKNFLSSVAGQIAIGITNARLYNRVQRQATTDGLTGLLNHHTGQDKLSEQIRLAERYQRNVAVVMIDIDHFKSINDTFGHPVGNVVLRSVAKLIQSDCRDVDFPVRYGGEEFLLILPEVNQEGALSVAERIRKKLASEPLTHDGLKIRVTGSFGVASFPENARTPQELLALADQALYLSKEAGRNCVHTAQHLSAAAIPKYKAENGSVTAPNEPGVSTMVPTAGSNTTASAEAPDKNITLPATVNTELPSSQTPALVGSPPATSSNMDALKDLASTLYARSEYNKSHHLETARLAEMVAQALKLPAQQIEQIRVAGLLHDVGMLAIPENILNREGLVSDEEMEMITGHCRSGAELLKPTAELKDIANIIEHHHECWDGTGYPSGLKGEQIPLAARILAIVDTYHAMISDRPYRKALSQQQALQALLNSATTQFDPNLVQIFVSALTQLNNGESNQDRLNQPNLNQLNQPDLSSSSHQELSPPQPTAHTQAVEQPRS